MVLLAAVPGQAIVHPREMKMERGAGSRCTMPPWIRNDCGHEFYSSLLLQQIPEPASFTAVQKPSACLMHGTKAAERGDSQVCRESMSAAAIPLWCA